MDSKNDLNKWVQGYVCAVCCMLQLDGQVETGTKELFSAGIGKTTLKKLKEQGVDGFDLQLLRKHWKELNRT